MRKPDFDPTLEAQQTKEIEKMLKMKAGATKLGKTLSKFGTLMIEEAPEFEEEREVDI
jgi:hypothetical protein